MCSKCLPFQDDEFHLGKNGQKLLNSGAVPTQNLPEQTAGVGQGLWNEALGAVIEMLDAQQEDDPPQIEADIPEPEHGVAQSGIPQMRAPERNWATQTERQSRNKAVQTVKTKEQVAEMVQLRAEEQKVAALQQEVRKLKVRKLKYTHRGHSQ